MSYLACFWVGGMVAAVLVAWCEYRRGSIPDEIFIAFDIRPVRSLLIVAFDIRPVRSLLIVAFLLAAWPAFLVWNAARDP